jgi:hypothetical protein
MRTQISPAVAGVVIVILVAIAGFLVWHFTSRHTSGPAPIPPWAKAALTNSGGMGRGGSGAASPMAPHPGGQR